MVVKDTKLSLVRVEYENFKKLNISQDFAADAKSVVVSGHNGAGKSSFIDGIFIALTGKEIPSNPIQVGKTQGSIKTVIKDDKAVYEATLSFKRQADDSIKREFTLKVDEVLYKNTKARDLLDEKLESIMFDVFSFIALKPMDKKKKLEELFKLDFSQIQGRKDALLEDTRKLDVKLTSYTEQINTIQLPEDGAKYEIIDISALASKLAEAKDNNAKVDKVHLAIKQAENKVTELLEVIKKAQADLDKVTLEHAELVKTSEPLKTIDIEPIQAKLNSAESNNKIVAQFAKVEELRALVEQIEAAKGQIKDKLKAVEQEKLDMIAGAGLPEGLEIGDKEVTYKGLALEEEQLSTAQLVEIGIQVLIAIGPNLKIARIKEASLLDAKTQAVIQAAVEKHGIIPFYEKVNNENLSIQINEVTSENNG